jgi:hypothetical protein
MSIISPQKEPLVFPPLQEGEDRFGLPLSPPTLLTTENARRELVDTIETLVSDLFKSAVRLLGRKEAKNLFIGVTKEQPKGKGCTHQDDDNLMLQKYDAFCEANPDQSRFAASQVAMDCKLQGRGTVDSLARRIRYLAKERDRERKDRERRLKAMEELCSPTLLERHETDL